MNTKLTALIAAMCLSTGVMAQTTPSSATSKTTTPSGAQTSVAVGEQNPSDMQNASGTQSTTKRSDVKPVKPSKTAKVKADCASTHTDGNVKTPATGADPQVSNTDCAKVRP